MSAVTKTFDPYMVLGVRRDATIAMIRGAYRAASKIHHPDAGGHPDDWESVQRAYDVLSNPKRRKSYDDTGQIEEVKPDNDRAAALQIIQMHFIAVMNEYLANGCAPQFDPRKKNVITAIAAKITPELTQAKQSIPRGREAVKFWEDMKPRFALRADAKESENFFAGRVDDERRECETKIAELELSVRVRELALAILDGYEFRFDLPAAPLFDGDVSFNSFPIGSGINGVSS